VPNISSKGDPGGNSNGRGFDLVVTVVVVDMLTTEGINLSARSANDDGIEVANEIEKQLIETKKTAKIFTKLFILLNTK
jgi:hypothetical protein